MSIPEPHQTAERQSNGLINLNLLPPEPGEPPAGVSEGAAPEPEGLPAAIRARLPMGWPEPVVELLSRWVPPHLHPLIDASVESAEFRALLLPTAFEIDAHGRSPWFSCTRDRLVADPVAIAEGGKYQRRVQLSGVGLPPPPAARASAGHAPRRHLHTALARVHYPRKAKRPARLTLPDRNWLFVQGLEERVRLVESAISDAIPLQVR
jgi:hypothetical protein